MNIWHDIAPERVTPEKFTAVIEIPKESNCKYELDKSTGLTILQTTALFRLRSLRIMTLSMFLSSVKNL